MPPKKKDQPSKKTEQKKKDKTVEDKTFGLKNKKGTKQQKFIQHVQKQVEAGPRKTQADKDKLAKMSEKDKKAKQKEELNLLFRPVQQLPKGVDPKSVLCAYFKSGSCTKGDKCKFSHDLSVARKSEKRSVYDDGKQNGESDNMDDWDEAKLEEVVNQKHGESNQAKPKTTIICKFFLDAVEHSKYGWFWQCPNGDQCHYKHVLPPGFVLKKDKKKMEDMKEVISLEELIERERAALSSKNLTKVTLESFLKWKLRKKNEKKSKARAAAEKKKSDYKAGKAYGLSGREMFEFDPELVTADDDGAEDVMTLTRDDSEDEDMETEESGHIREINLEELDYIGGDSPAAPGPAERGAGASEPASAAAASDRDESGKLDMAGALPPNPADPEVETDAAIAAAMAATIDGSDIIDSPIDENLFDGEDLDFVEEELDTLELVD